MDKNRRSFIKRAGCTAIGLSGLPLMTTGCAPSHGHDESKKQWAMVIDIEKCKDEEIRAACAEACHKVHNVPNIEDAKRKVEWVWSVEFEKAFPDQTHAHMREDLQKEQVLVLCNHCTNPPCVKVCPTKATWKRKSDGIVTMDMHRCIGCRYCMVACPYGSRSFNWSDPREDIATDDDGKYLSDYPTRSQGVVEKCSFCCERVRNAGDEGDPVPACVEAANQIEGGEGALTFGNLGDPDSEVNQLLREKFTISRRVSLGTGPNVFYIV
jgi:Fe-S-cluster-containing dehydrogenase component